MFLTLSFWPNQDEQRKLKGFFFQILAYMSPMKNECYQSMVRLHHLAIKIKKEECYPNMLWCKQNRFWFDFLIKGATCALFQVLTAPKAAMALCSVSLRLLSSSMENSDDIPPSWAIKDWEKEDTGPCTCAQTHTLHQVSKPEACGDRVENIWCHGRRYETMTWPKIRLFTPLRCVPGLTGIQWISPF